MARLVITACALLSVSNVLSGLPPATEAHLAAARRSCEELGKAVRTLESRGQGQYSRMSYEVVRYTLDAIEKVDLPNGSTNRVIREAKELAVIAPRALEKAKRILSGEEKDVPVPRFKSGPVTTRGSIIYGRREWPDGRIEENRPVMLNGWGHFHGARRDMEFLNMVGGNFLQQEVGLVAFEPAPGKETVKALDNFFEAADRGVRTDTPVDLHLCAHYMAGWALKGRPELRRCKNHFMGFCVHDPHVVGVITNFQTRVATLTKDHPGLLSYCLTNEPGSQDVSKCPQLKKKWTAYLAERYGNVGRMNELWGTNYAGFDAVEMPAWPDLPKTPLGLEFVRCNRRAFSDFHQRLVDAVRAVAPKVPLHSKLLIDTSLGSPDTKSIYGFPFWSNDGLRFAEMFDWLDHDGVYFTEPKGTWPNRWVSHQMASDFLRSFADKPLMNTENHICQDNSAGMYISPEHAYSAIWQEAIHGMRMSAQWCWERGTKKLRVFEGLPPERPECLEAMGRCSLDLARLSDQLVPIQSEPPTVLMMWSLSSKVLDKRHDGCYAAASFLGEPLGFVTEEILERFLKDGRMRRPRSSARVIILPGVTHLPDASVMALKKLESKGIKIFAIGAELGYDDFGRPRGETPWKSASRRVAVEKAGDDPFGGAVSDTIADVIFEMKSEVVAKTLFGEMKGWGLPSRPRLVNPVFGVESHGYEKDGVRRIALCNHTRKPLEVELDSDGVDLISGKPTSRRFTLPPLVPMFVELAATKF